MWRKEPTVRIRINGRLYLRKTNSRIRSDEGPHGRSEVASTLDGRHGRALHRLLEPRLPSFPRGRGCRLRLVQRMPVSNHPTTTRLQLSPGSTMRWLDRTYTSVL
jgi:hypothetical protein